MVHVLYLNFIDVNKDAVKCKQRQQGRSEAAGELVSRLLGYKHWRGDLQEALIVPGSGLEDLRDTLSSTLVRLKS